VHAPGVRLLESRYDPQERRLPAPGRTEQREKLSSPDLEIDVVDGRRRAKSLGDLVDVYGRVRSGHFREMLQATRRP